jgi:hypothetical protein
VPSPKGNYTLTGITDVDAQLPIRKLIDRGFPDYSYPTPSQAPFAQNYMNYIKSRQRLGEATERIEVGSSTQIRLRQHPDRYNNFAVRNLAANGEVWTGVGDKTQKTFPDLQTLGKQDYPSENMCSIALRLTYGKFDYFTGGDLLSGTEEESAEPWRDIETAVAKAAGPVEVAVADHHAYLDAVGPSFVPRLLSFRPGTSPIQQPYRCAACSAASSIQGTAMFSRHARWKRTEYSMASSIQR